MREYEAILMHGMFGDYWTVIVRSGNGSVKEIPYFDTENDAKSFITRLKEYYNDYR